MPRLAALPPASAVHGSLTGSVSRVEYLTRLVDIAFRELEDGSVAFFPYGAAGDAYRIESPARYRHIRSFVRRYYLRTLPVIVVLGLGLTSLAMWGMGGGVASLVAAAVSVAFLVLVAGVTYRTRVRRLVAGLDTCDASLDVERYLFFPGTFPDLYEMHLWGVGFAAAALFGLMSIFPDADARLVGLGAGALGLAGGWAKVTWKR